MVENVTFLFVLSWYSLSVVGPTKFIFESGNLTLRINSPSGEQSTCLDPSLNFVVACRSCEL